MKDYKKGKILEEDLYIPVRDYLIMNGFDVKAEVEHCDVAACKEDCLLVVEMKISLNLDVILQAALRQRIADIVYIAVPKKAKVLFTSRWKNICHLLRRLELGLLLVSFRGNETFVEEALKAEFFNREMSKKKSGKKKKLLLQEFSSRHGDYNTGGCKGKKLVTAYREMAIHIAALLQKHETLSIKSLKDLGTDNRKTSEILQDNYYGWYKRISRGIYTLSDTGKQELAEYRQLVEYYKKMNS